jgi:hypothetical protein
MVIFPEGETQLRIFEPRYIDMISECLRTDSGFGICLIKEGKEVGENTDFFNMGTFVKIIDWDQMDDGLLGIRVKGERRFRVNNAEIRSDNLNVGEVEWLDEDDAILPDSYQSFSDLLKVIGNRYELPFLTDSERFDEANWVSDRLADLLPFEISAKQELLEMDNALHRFDYMQGLLEKIDVGDLAYS